MLNKTSNDCSENSEYIKRYFKEDKLIALAGNPNVGKSTIFNALTGMNQHTGNWPGKTVSNARGRFSTEKFDYTLVDVPGTYSLMSHSAEEEIARNFICFGNTDAVIIVCDATCLERNMNLVLQTMEITDNVIVCVNLLDEAERKNISVDLEKLSKILNVPVIGTSVQDENSVKKITEVLDCLISGECESKPPKVNYPTPIEDAIEFLLDKIDDYLPETVNKRWIALKLLEDDRTLIDEFYCYYKITHIVEIEKHIKSVKEKLKADNDKFKDDIVTAIYLNAELICCDVVRTDNQTDNKDRITDKILTSKHTGIPIMIVLLCVILWITIYGANYPSEFLSEFLFSIQYKLTGLLELINAPWWVNGIFVEGMYRVLAWVVSVMLPPMAIFFPLFTLLEDVGYLPRIAFNLDKPFKKCKACGKQALTMCMGFGCNAVGVTGCRIIDSPRERLVAILTNSLVPCNGKFPTLIAIITMFFVTSRGIFSSVTSSVILTLTIVLGIIMTFIISKILTSTLLKGVPSSFTLELPPFRRPQFKKVLIRSVLDRTLFVLARAVKVAAPAGIVIWLMANISIEGFSILEYCTNALDPIGRLLGLDGVIIMAFILGLPANEIVLPIIIMAYMSQGTLVELDSLNEMKTLFIQNGWTWKTAVSMMMFSLMHWPCSTTLMTIKKETGSFKWAVLAALLPTVAGVVLCLIFNFITKML